MVSVNLFDYTLNSSLRKDMLLLILSIILLVVYSFAVMGYNNKVHSRVSVVMYGLLTIVISVIETMLLGVLISG